MKYPVVELKKIDEMLRGIIPDNPEFDPIRGIDPAQVKRIMQRILERNEVCSPPFDLDNMDAAHVEYIKSIFLGTTWEGDLREMLVNKMTTSQLDMILTDMIVK